MTTVIKISGSELDDPVYVERFAQIVRNLDAPPVIVHGGGKEISEMQRRMNIEPRYFDGVRMTDAESLVLVEMVLCGTINKRLVRVLVNAGIDALGMSGVDRGMIRADKMRFAAYLDMDMGFTGVVTSVRAEVVRDYLNARWTPVIAPICMGATTNYNVNADHVAGAVAGSIGAERLIFLSNVLGVLDKNKTLIPALNATQTASLIADGTIFGGMIPKVRVALEALERGAQTVVIGNLDTLATGVGTTFTQE
ncbi:MAG: acetylglutamate kinase [Chloroflexota bacterium]|nr:acetylglutamate kinase [Chloroflexota bacterium]